MGFLSSNPQIFNAPAAAPQPDMRAQLAAEEAQARAQAQAAQVNPLQQIADACARINACGYGFPTLTGNAAQAYAQIGGQSVMPGYTYPGIMAPPGARRSLHSIPLSEPQHILQIAAELDAERGNVAPAAPVAPPVQLPPPVQQMAQAVAQGPAFPTPQAGGILPPDAPVSQPQLATVQTPPPANADPNYNMAQLEDAEKTAKKRGRPAKKAQDAAPEQTAAVAAQVPPASVPAPQVAPVSTPSSVGSPVSTSSSVDGPRVLMDANGVVLINARSSSFQTKSLADYVDYINRELSKRYCVDGSGQATLQDVRCAPKDSPLAFGGWKGAVRELVKADPPPPDAYHLDTFMDELNEAVADALRIVAERGSWIYVRGVR